MTETISTRNEPNRTLQSSFFKQYLRYNLAENGMFFVISIVFSVVSIPLFLLFVAITSHDFVADDTSTFLRIMPFITIFAIISIFGLYALSISGGTRCFQHLTRRNKTDTLMCLPLTHSQRFWGDFLTGYITGVSPIIPCGILGIIIGAIAQYSYPIPHFTRLVLVYVATLFFIMTFAYVLSVLAASLCGNIAGGIVTSILLALITAGIPSLWGIYFKSCIAGYPLEFAFQSSTDSPVPSIFMIGEFNETLEINRIWGILDVEEFLEKDFSVENPLNIIIYTLLCAGVSLLAYYISKFRKYEHTGETFATKYSATIITILLCITVTGVIYILFKYNAGIIFLSITSIVLSAIICLAAELILRRGKKKLGKRIITYAVAAFATVGVTVLLYGTDALGYSYYLPKADKIVSAEYSSNSKTVLFTFNKKSDIEKFRENHNQLLKNYMSNFRTNLTYIDLGEVTIEYTLDNGKKFTRCYSTTSAKDRIQMQKCRDALYNLHTSLEDYAPQLADSVMNSPNDEIYLSTGGTFGGYQVYPDKISEFKKILHDDILNHFNPALLPIGIAKASDKDDNKTNKIFSILDTYENTLAFVKNPENAEFRYSDNPIRYHISITNEDIDLFVKISNDDCDSPAVKELESLMKICNPLDGETIYSEEYERALKISSSDFFRYYIPQENIPQAVKLITQIASERS
ncbi:MAG: hypothetical protein ACI4JS_10465 [Oscillospiraceae bacterium]